MSGYKAIRVEQIDVKGNILGLAERLVYGFPELEGVDWKVRLQQIIDSAL